MSQNTGIVVFILVLSTVLIIGLTLLFGPEGKVTNNSTFTNNNQSSTSEENLPAPLTSEELAAYYAEVTNEKNPIAHFVTNQGDFDIELFEDTMPVTTGNFIKLAEEGFYNDQKFHRVIKDFMIQGGDPNSKTDNTMTYGTGGSDPIPDEFIKGDYLTNRRGTIAMANKANIPNSGSSQFFINVIDNFGLDFDKLPSESKHPVFGQVISGMGVVDKISQTKTSVGDIPIEPVIIKKVEIVRK